MIDFEVATRLIAIRERLRAATWRCIKKDGHHKMDEGSVSLSFHMPPVVGDERENTWSVSVYSYVLNPDGRIGEWSGRTSLEAIAKAEDEIARWCFASELEEFEEQFNGPDA
jgi:hypothetical protein